jgi:hypothetical protein
MTARDQLLGLPSLPFSSFSFFTLIYTWIEWWRTQAPDHRGGYDCAQRDQLLGLPSLPFSSFSFRYTNFTSQVVGNEFIRGLSGGGRKRLTIAEAMTARSAINCWDCLHFFFLPFPFLYTNFISQVVGNEFIRGLSGGERKRLTIAEAMTARSAINCWDCTTRGLDSASALDYIKSMRIMSNTLHRTNIVSLYPPLLPLFLILLLIRHDPIIFFSCRFFHELKHVFYRLFL